MAGANAESSRPLGEGLTMMVNSVFNGWRMEDVWLDRLSLSVGDYRCSDTTRMMWLERA
jgi:hypothetical protein